MEQLPRNGSYFTKEIAVANTSIVVVRGMDGRCARSTTSAATGATSWCGPTTRAKRPAGVARQFVCKYHGWKYDLDGACVFVQQEREFFDFDKADFGLVPVHCDVWAGFIFVNLDRDPRQSRTSSSAR